MIEKWLENAKIEIFESPDSEWLHVTISQYSGGQSIERPPLWERTVYIKKNTEGRDFVFEYTDSLLHYVASCDYRENMHITVQPNQTLYKLKDNCTDSLEHKPMMYQKLVRDNIPTIIEANGETCVTRKLTEKKYEEALAEKLKEEVAELLEAYTAKERSALDCAEEMADVMEVLYAMGKTCAVSKRDVEQVRSQKAAEKGTFSKRVFLVSTEK